jgi:hypothetical protein
MISDGEAERLEGRDSAAESCSASPSSSPPRYDVDQLREELRSVRARVFRLASQVNSQATRITYLENRLKLAGITP